MPNIRYDTFSYFLANDSADNVLSDDTEGYILHVIWSYVLEDMDGFQGSKDKIEELNGVVDILMANVQEEGFAHSEDFILDDISPHIIF